MPASIEKAVHTTLIIGFSGVDWLFFHDLLKPGEGMSPAQLLVGLLSVLVFITSTAALVRARMKQDVA